MKDAWIILRWSEIFAFKVAFHIRILCCERFPRSACMMTRPHHDCDSYQWFLCSVPLLQAQNQRNSFSRLHVLKTTERRVLCFPVLSWVSRATLSVSPLVVPLFSSITTCRRKPYIDIISNISSCCTSVALIHIFTPLKARILPLFSFRLSAQWATGRLY